MSAVPVHVPGSLPELEPVRGSSFRYRKRAGSARFRYGLSVVSEPLEPTGVGVYAVELARSMAPLLAAGERLVLARHPRFSAAGIAGVEHALLTFPAGRSAVRRAAEQFLLPARAVACRLTLLHTVNTVVPLLYPGPKVVTVHDTRLFEARRKAGASRFIFRTLVYPLSLRKASRIICVSTATAREIERLFPASSPRLRVIPNGVSAAFFEPPGADAIRAVRRRLGLAPDRPYLFFAGSFEPHKNLERLVSAFASARRTCAEAASLALVLAGPGGPSGPALRERARAEGVADHVLFPGYLDLQALRASLAGALALVFVSLLEGFGLPVLEAMASGTPVLTSDRPALRECAGGAALAVDPEDASAIAAAIARLSSDAALRTVLSRRGRERARLFGWDRTAAATLAIYREVAIRARGR